MLCDPSVEEETTVSCWEVFLPNFCIRWLLLAMKHLEVGYSGVPSQLLAKLY